MTYLDNYNLDLQQFDMEPDNQAISAQILIEVQGTVMHRFVQNQKSLFTSGTCKIAKIQNPNSNIVYFINLNSFYYTLNKNLPFVRLQYEDTISYLFPHFDNGLSSLTLLKNSIHIHNFEQILKNAASLSQFDQAIQNPEIKAKIDEHCPKIKEQSIYCADNVKKTIKDAGKFLGTAFKTIGGYISTGIQKAGSFFETKIDGSGEKEPVSGSTKQKWEKLKTGTNDFFNVSGEYVNKIFGPVVEKGKELTNQLSDKIDQSDNEKIKYAKELAGVSGQAINQAFVGLAEGSCEVGKEISNQSKQIVKKKLGQDYVKTFLDGEEQKKEEKLEQKTEEEVLVAKEQKIEKKEDSETPDQKKEQLYPRLSSQD